MDVDREEQLETRSSSGGASVDLRHTSIADDMATARRLRDMTTREWEDLQEQNAADKELFSREEVPVRHTVLIPYLKSKRSPFHDHSFAESDNQAAEKG